MSQNDKQLALLKNRLQMPLIVRELLSNSKMPSGEETYAMHCLFSDFSIEDSLLCGAFVMKEIADLGNICPADMAFMHMECERLIERYSARDDLAQENPELWNDTQVNVLDDMAEDLECFLDLLALCKLSYEITSQCVASILEILDVQLQSQLLIIDEVIEMHQAAALEQKEVKRTTKATTSNVIAAQFGASGDNILLFPVSAQNQSRAHH
jgi:hypothetical protein